MAVFFDIGDTPASPAFFTLASRRAGLPPARGLDTELHAPG